MSKAIISTAEAAIAAEHFVKEILLSELMIFASQAQEELDRVVNFLLTGYSRNMQTIQAALQAVSFVERLCCVNLLLKTHSCLHKFQNTGG